jgi:hypothetical protein
MRQDNETNAKREKQSFTPGNFLLAHDFIDAPSGKKLEGLKRGLVRGAATDFGTGVGISGGAGIAGLLAARLLRGKGRQVPLAIQLLFPDRRSDSKLGKMLLALGNGALVGGAGGGYAGYKIGDKIMGTPSWRQPATEAVSKAASVKDYLRNAAFSIADQPALTAGLTGAGLGAGIAGLSSLTTEQKRKRMLRNMLMGAMAGGAVGAGSNIAASKLQGATPKGRITGDVKRLVSDPMIAGLEAAAKEKGVDPNLVLMAARQKFSPFANQPMLKKTSFDKQAVNPRGFLKPLLAGIGKYTGGAIDAAGGAAGRGIAAAWKKSRMGTGLGLGLGAPLLGSAGIEGVAKLTGNKHWSPELQYYRDAANNNVLDSIFSFYKRPIQSVFGSRVPLSPENLLRQTSQGGGLPGVTAKYTGLDAQGKPQYSYGGGGSADVPEYVQQALRKARELNNMYAPMSTNTRNSGSRDPYSYRDRYFNLKPREIF